MKTILLCKITALLLMAVFSASCKGNKCSKGNGETYSAEVAKDDAQSVLKHLGVDKKKVMPYVVCSEQTVDSLLVIGDSVYSEAANCDWEYLGMDNEVFNKQLEAKYKDTLQTALAFLKSYDSVVHSGKDKVNAAFVWHEVARQQMKRSWEKDGGKRQERGSREKIFDVIDSVMEVYAGGTNADMIMVAWRMSQLVEYRLIEAYKQLADLCDDRSMINLIHDDHAYTLATFVEYEDANIGYHSMLPLENGMMFDGMLEFKLKNINQLIKEFKKGEIDTDAVKKNLNEHMCVWQNKRVELTRKLLESEKERIWG